MLSYVREGVLCGVARCRRMREAPSDEVCGFSRRGELRLAAVIREPVVITDPLVESAAARWSLLLVVRGEICL